MKSWQKYWLYGVLIFFTFHSIRDVFQDLHIHSLISDSFVKGNLGNTPVWYWQVFNTYVIEITEILLASIALRKNRFGLTGLATVVVAILFSVVWGIYWFFL